MGPHVPLQRDLVLYASAAIPMSPLLFSWLGLCSTQYYKTASTDIGGNARGHPRTLGQR